MEMKLKVKGTYQKLLTVTITHVRVVKDSKMIPKKILQHQFMRKLKTRSMCRQIPSQIPNSYRYLFQMIVIGNIVTKYLHPILPIKVKRKYSTTDLNNKGKPTIFFRQQLTTLWKVRKRNHPLVRHVLCPLLEANQNAHISASEDLQKRRRYITWLATIQLQQ